MLVQRAIRDILDSQVVGDKIGAYVALRLSKKGRISHYVNDRIDRAVTELFAHSVIWSAHYVSEKEIKEIVAEAVDLNFENEFQHAKDTAFRRLNASDIGRPTRGAEGGGRQRQPFNEEVVKAISAAKLAARESLRFEPRGGRLEYAPQRPNLDEYASRLEAARYQADTCIEVASRIHNTDPALVEYIARYRACIQADTPNAALLYILGEKIARYLAIRDGASAKNVYSDISPEVEVELQLLISSYAILAECFPDTEKFSKAVSSVITRSRDIGAMLDVSIRPLLRSAAEGPFIGDTTQRLTGAVASDSALDSKSIGGASFPFAWLRGILSGIYRWVANQAAHIRGNAAWDAIKAVASGEAGPIIQSALAYVVVNGQKIIELATRMPEMFKIFEPFVRFVMRYFGP